MQKATNYCWGDEMRERRYLTFDMQNPRHREAFSLFTAQPSKLRSEFVVNCILEAQETERLEKIVRREFSEALKGAAISVDALQQAEMKIQIQATEKIFDLPDVLLTSLENI